MPDILSQALTLEGLWLIVLGAVLSGIVRGFSGFGTALIFIPLAGQVVPPIWVITILVVMDMFGPAPNLPRAWRDGAAAQVGWLLLGAVVCLPLGLAILVRVSPEAFRYAVSLLAIAAPIVLSLGLRYHGPMSRPLLTGTGGASGFLGGVAGLPGPPVILLYMAGPNPPALIRANTMLYLYAYDLMLLALLGLQGRLEAVPVVLGLLMALPNIAGNILGARVFHPDRARVYRGAAYAITIAAAISGLPLWD
ncbi:sulfite exporter TauE/SafE family protein [Lutimaribacter saemankumensis]|uniref:Probable membrane transporter protein n=1 Tax=Lutimaribacter saemankumensis TaxID=490829 RepID=A0A1G8RVL3_9RHOB|nr:sulfite exporter TauE/SafE family protein [Lutimaribacter saemankumensis]SDJ20979.1 hypothetical protein SAMN05421850_11025 [Lutimaribacter saemankumensis]